MESLLFGIRNTDDTTKINEAVKKGTSILPPNPDGYNLGEFCDILDEACDRTKDRLPERIK